LALSWRWAGLAQHQSLGQHWHLPWYLPLKRAFCSEGVISNMISALYLSWIDRFVLGDLVESLEGIMAR